MRRLVAVSVRQHFGLGDPGEETEMAEFQLRGLAQEIVDPVGGMTELKPAQVGQQLIPFFGSHVRISSLFSRFAGFFFQQPLVMLD